MFPFAVVILLVAMLVAVLVCILLTSPTMLILVDAFNSSVFSRGWKIFFSFPTPYKTFTGKNNGFPFLDILGYLKNTHKNPKFGKGRQVPTRDWDLSHSSKFGIFVGIL